MVCLINIHSATEVKYKVKLSLYKCFCGKKFLGRKSDVKRGFKKSCGCLKGGSTKHGHKKRSGQSNEYNAWVAMKQRCYNKKTNSYKNYGGRGIKVCDRWLKSYINFYEDMGNKPDKSYSIDRIDNDGNYEPSNCKWSTRTEQNLNQRRNTK